MPLDLAKLQNVTPTSDGWQAACPMCRYEGGDQTGNHLHVWRNGAFNCVVSGNTDRDHNRGILALAGVGTDGVPTVYEPEPEPKVELPEIWPVEVLAGLVQDNSYWNGRGISDETLAPFRGGVATRFQMADRYVFPIFNEDGEIVGFDGRCIRPGLSAVDRKRLNRVKWKILGASSTFLWGGLDEIVDCGEADLVESIGDSLKLREFGRPQNACLFGTTLSETLLGFLIKANPRRIRVATNRDKEKLINGKMRRPGQDAALKIKRTLDRFFDEGVVEIVHPPEHRNDWDECTREEVEAAFAPAVTTAMTEESSEEEEMDA